MLQLLLGIVFALLGAFVLSTALALVRAGWWDRTHHETPDVTTLPELGGEGNMAHFVIDRQRKLVTVAFSGCVSAEDVYAYFSQLASHADFRPEFSELADCSAVSDSIVSRADLELLATRDPYAPGARRAIVLAADLPFGMGRMYEMIAERPNLRVFRTHSEAFEWLRLFSPEMQVRGA